MDEVPLYVLRSPFKTFISQIPMYENVQVGIDYKVSS